MKISNQTKYNQARNNGATHEEAAGALNVTPDAARMLKSRYNKAKDIQIVAGAKSSANTSGAGLESAPTTKPRKVKDPELEAFIEWSKQKPAPEVVTRAAGIAAIIPTIATPDLQTVRNAAVSLLLIAVVIGHAGLVWYDCWDRWSIPGAIGGGVVFLIVLAALLLASDETKPRTSEAALWFVFITDFAAWFVHFPVFRDRAQIGDIETGVFAGFLCAASFTALYLYRDSKLD